MKAKKSFHSHKKPTSLIRNWIKSYLEYIYKSQSLDRHRNEELSVELNPEAHLLDLGCREGNNTLKIACKIGTLNITGIDYNLSALGQASKHGIKCVRADLNYPFPLPDNEFDVVFASNVVEHLVNPSLFIEEIYRVLKPGGYFMLDTPNLASWHNIFALVIGLQPFSGPNITNMEDAEVSIVREMHRTDHGLPEEGENLKHNEQELTRHILVMAFRSLVRLIQGTGFVIEKKWGFGYYPFPPFLAKLLQRINPAHAHHISIKARKPLNDSLIR